MNPDGILTAAICFACIGAFHPLVIWAEYRFSARCWPLFLLAGLGALAGSLLAQSRLLSAALGVLGCSCLWSIRELRQQEQRVERGWFPKNPRRNAREHAAPADALPPGKGPHDETSG